MNETIKYKAILIDDEKSNRVVLKKLMEQHCPEIEVVSECADIDDAYKKINALKPDVIFLDIRMPQGDGFNLLSKFDEYSFEVIFVTSYDQYALHALKASALDYLLKPVERKDLMDAVNKFKKRYQEKTPTNSDQIKNLISDKEKKVAIHHKGNVVLLPTKEINYVEADVNYSNVYTDLSHYYVSKTLAEWEELLTNDGPFIRVNKSIIVNSNYCSYYEKGSPIFLVLKNNLKIPVSRRRRSEVLERLKVN